MTDEQFTIGLPPEAIEEIENGLIPFGHYGKFRATVCRSLILDLLKTPAVRGHIQEGRAKKAAVPPISPASGPARSPT